MGRAEAGRIPPTGTEGRQESWGESSEAAVSVSMLHSRDSGCFQSQCRDNLTSGGERTLVPNPAAVGCILSAKYLH